MKGQIFNCGKGREMTKNNKNMHVQNSAKPPQNSGICTKNSNAEGLYRLEENELREITDIMLQTAHIHDRRTSTLTRKEYADETELQIYPPPTCHYVGQQQHHMGKHRRKNRHAAKYGKHNKNKGGNARAKRVDISPTLRKN